MEILNGWWKFFDSLAERIWQDKNYIHLKQILYKILIKHCKTDIAVEMELQSLGKNSVMKKFFR